MRFNISTLIVAILLSGCLRQSAPDVEPDFRSGISDQRRLEACSRLNFGSEFLYKSNIEALFQCTRWDREFPDLFNAILSIEARNWNKLMGPISSEFFDNKGRRDRVIKYLQDLDDVGALDSIGNILDAVNEINFYSAWKELFQCLKGVSNPRCLPSKKNEITYSEIEMLLSLFDQSEETWALFARLADETRRVFGSDYHILISTIRDFFRSKSFPIQTLDLVGTVLNGYEEGITDETAEFLKNIFGYDEYVQNIFFYYLINESTLGVKEFVDLVTYFVRQDSEFYKDLRVLDYAISRGVSCQPTSENRYLRFSFLEEARILSETLARGDQVEAFDTLISRSSTLRAAEPFCPPLRAYSREIKVNKDEQLEHTLSFVGLLRRAGDYLLEPERFELTSFLSRINPEVDDRDVLLSLISGDVFYELNRINKTVVKESPDFFSVLFRFLRRVEKESYEDLSILIELLLNESTRSSLEAASKLWNFFTTEERKFVFRIVNNHLDEDLNLSALLQFYSRLLYEIADSSSVFHDQWFRDEDSLAELRKGFESFAYAFAGKKVLNDFRRFYSRDHILEVIKVLTRGMSLVEESLREFEYIYSDEYLVVSRRPIVPDLDPRVPLRYTCLVDLSSSSENLYTLVESFPQSCEGEMEQDISLSFMSWLNKIQNDFKLKYGDSKNPFGETGVISPRLLGETVLNAKLIDGIFRGGLSDLLKRVFEHVFDLSDGERRELGYLWLLEEVLSLVNQTFLIDELYSRELRNAIVKKWAMSENRGNHAILNFLNDYSQWLMTSYKEEKVLPNSFFSCARYLNPDIGYRCPQSADEVVDSLEPILRGLITRHERRGETPLNLFYDAFRGSGGVTIPLGGSHPRLYRMSIAETLELLYRKADKTRNINRLQVEHQNSLSSPVRNEVMTTLERIEVVIRDVRFGNNYLGVQYLNYVAHGDDYDEDVQNRKRTLRNCIRLPVVRCGRTMSRDERRQATNALEAFDGLLDVNNGRRLDPAFSYGDYMVALLGVIVGSSPIEAQRVRLLPLSDDVLELHNGKLLGSLTATAGFSHMGRWVHDRIATDEDELESFLSSYSVNFLDRTLLENTPRHLTKAIFERIIQKVLLRGDDGLRPIDDIVEWIFSLERESLIKIERIAGRLLVALAHIGDEELILKKDSSGRYSDNQLYDLFQLSELVLENWTTLRRVFSNDDVEKLVQHLEPLSIYLLESLESSSTRERSYVFINEMFLTLRDILFVYHDSSRIVDRENMRYRGYELLRRGLADPSFVQRIKKVIMGALSYLNAVDGDSGGVNTRGRWLNQSAQALLNLYQDHDFSSAALNDYLLQTTKNANCLQDGFCEANPHYDELALFIDYLLVTKNGKTNLRSAFEVMKSREDEITEFLNRVMRGIVLEGHLYDD